MGRVVAPLSKAQDRESADEGIRVPEGGRECLLVAVGGAIQRSERQLPGRG